MNRIRGILEFYDYPCTEKLLEKFEIYMYEILKWNESINLTSIKNQEEFIEKHFVDSIAIIGYEEFINARTVIDIGTGAGFPGIPLALVAPGKEFVLVDSLHKRLNIIDKLAGQLKINNVTVVHARAEELAREQKHREKYDLCVSRAVANLSTLSEYCMPFVKIGGSFLSYKGTDYKQELSESKYAINTLGGKLNSIRDVQVEGFSLEHNIICIDKIKSTPKKYPRKAGTPSKEPLK